MANNVWYLDEQSIIYPAGANLVIFNIDQKMQKFIPCSAGTEGITALAVSPNKRYAAVAEKRSERPSITVFDLTTLRKRKVLSSSDVSSQEYVCLAFSPDSKYLITQAGTPDWTLLYWYWEKSKVMATTKSNGATNYAMHHVSFNPQDNTQVCVVGEKTFKLFRYSEGNLKQFAFMKADPLNYLCQAWISEDRLVLGSDNGRVQLFEVGELKNEFRVSLLPGSQEGSVHSSKLSLPRPSSSEKPLPRVECIVAYSKGFVCSGGSGKLHLFEKTDNRNVYRETRTASIWVDPSSRLTHPREEEGDDPASADSNDILSLTLSPSEENVVCSTRSQQLYNLTLSAADLGKGGGAGTAAFDFLTYPFHHGEVTGMDVCIRKPIIATCSLDKSVRIWNYESNSLDLWREFPEEAYSVALHPSGLSVLVGFSEKLRLMSLLIDDIRPYKEFMIRGCRECAFSNGGHMFAAANTNLIQVFSTYTFENIGNLKGHNGKVRCIVWSPDDSRLVTCSMDGAVYEWTVQSYKRERECVLKSCSYTSLAVTPDLRTTFAVGSDRTLKEMILADSNILRQVSAGDVVLTQVVLSHSGKMLFTGTSSGSVRVMKFPLGDQGEFQECQAHCTAVSRMRMSYDDQYLFSVGQDGSLLAFRVSDKEGRGYKRDKDIAYAEEVLVTKSDLEEKNTMMSELKTRVDELKMENEYQLRLKDMNYGEKIKDLTDKFLQEIEALKAKNETLKTDREKEQARYEEETQELVERQSTELQERENSNSQKLMAEYEKYQELQARSQRLQEDYERRLSDMEEARERALQELTEHYEAKLQEKNIQLEQAADEKRQQTREGEELQRQTEEDADREILDLKNNYERQLRQSMEKNTKLRGEVGILGKKVGTLQEDMNGLRSDIQHLKLEVKKRDGVIASLKTDIEGLKREIQERDATIHDKEKRIYDLKKKNQELEKFKFVLDYKIKELRRQMEPRENEIKRMKDQIRKMEAELSGFSRDNKELLLEMEKQKLRLDATSKEMMRERQLVHLRDVELRNIKGGLHKSSRFVQEPKQLKEAVKELYRKHLQDFDQGSTHHAAEGDMHSEYGRQREHLERSVAALRKKLAKDTEIHRQDNIRVMQENVSLLKEINDLRQELKKTRTHAHDLGAIVTVARKQGFDEQAARTATKPLTPLTGLAKVEPENSSRIIEMQKAEIGRLRRELESVRRPASSSRLPPVQSTPVPVQ